MVNTDLPERKLARNFFCVETSLLPDKIKEEFLELKCNCVAKDDLKTMPISDFSLSG